MLRCKLHFQRGRAEVSLAFSKYAFITYLFSAHYTSFLTDRKPYYTRYRIALIGSDGTNEAEFVLFGRIAQQITHKPILNLLRAERPMHEPLHALVAAAHARSEIPNEIASIVSQKYCFVVSVTEKSFLRREPSFQVHRIATSFGKQLHSSLFHITSTSSQPDYNKDANLPYQNIAPVHTDLPGSSQLYREPQPTTLLMNQPHQSSVL